MRQLKIAIIGSGSTYTPELIEGFIKRKDVLYVGAFYMMDINAEKNKIVSSLAARMLKKSGLEAKVVMCDNFDEAIIGADYICGQIRVGQLDARIRDERIPLKYDLLGQETTGVGGFMKALRTIPVIYEIAEKIEKLAPDAWFINFSNPAGIIAEMLLNHTNINALGLCNVPIGMITAAKKILPSGTKTFDYDFVGLNHLCWLSGIYADGKEILQDNFMSILDHTGLKNIPKITYDETLLNTIKAVPCDYLNYYYFREIMVDKYKSQDKVRGEVCKEIEAELLELYQDESLQEKPKILEKRGGALYSEAAVSLVDAIENDKNEVHVVNVKNQGAYDFMNNNDIVETKAVIGKHGAKPVKLEGFKNEHIKGLMQSVKAYEKLTVEAGLTGDYNTALEALLVHPLIGDYKKAKAVLNDMLKANKEYLPQFKMQVIK